MFTIDVNDGIALVIAIACCAFCAGFYLLNLRNKRKEEPAEPENKPIINVKYIEKAAKISPWYYVLVAILGGALLAWFLWGRHARGESEKRTGK